MKNFYNILKLAAIITFTVIATANNCFAQDGRELLENALEQMPKQNFSATIVNPLKDLPDKRSLNFPPFWKYVQNYDAGTQKTLARVELNYPEYKFIYLHNNDGYFAISPYEKDGKLLYSQVLQYIESFSLKLNPAELAAATYTVTETTYDNKPCFVVSMTIPNNPELLMELTGMTEKDFASYGAEYIKNRAFAREFIIGRKTPIIYSRRSFSANGNILNEQLLKDVVLDPIISAKTFAVPDNVVDNFLDETIFTTRILDEKSKNEQPATVLKLSGLKTVLLYAIIALCIIGLLWFIIYLKKRNRC